MPGAFGAMWRDVRLALAALFANAAWRRAAFFLMPYVGVLVGLDVAARYAALTRVVLPDEFSLNSDRGFGEYFEYSLTAAIAVMLFLLWMRSRAGIYLLNALLFAYLTLDNSLRIHENFGHWSEPLMPKNLPLKPNHIGEAVLLVSIGIVWLVALVIAFRTARLRPAINALILAAGVAGAAFFGVLADGISSWGSMSLKADVVASWIEDGGEFAMIFLTFLATCAMFDIERRREGWAQ